MTIRNQRYIVAESNGGLPVNLQDQTSPALIIPMLSPIASTTLSAPTVLESYTIEITSATGVNIGDHCRIIDPGNSRFYQGIILNLVGTTVTVDTPLDFVYASGVEFATGTANMNVNGSVTPGIYQLRIGATSVPTAADITRLVMTCETATAIDLNKFGDIAGGLTRGLVFRTRDGIFQNIFNVKTNKELAGLAYDFTPYLASNPALGIDGFVMRLTFAGQEKMGVALRVAQDDNLEIWVQDDLTSLTSLSVNLEGHAVVDD